MTTRCSCYIYISFSISSCCHYKYNYQGFICRYEVTGSIANLPTTLPPLPTAGPSKVLHTSCSFEYYCSCTSYTFSFWSKVPYNGEKDCGLEESPGRIVGGLEVPSHLYPWMV